MEAQHLTPISVRPITLKTLSFGLAVDSLRYKDETFLADDEGNILATDDGHELTT